MSAFNLTADVLVFKLSDVICLMAGFAILTVLNKVIGSLDAAAGGTENFKLINDLFYRAEI